MTTQTKQYIEISDMASVRYECKQCRTSVAAPINGFSTPPVQKCPNCRKGWTMVENTSHDEEIENFITSAIHLKGVLKSLGFSLSIEIKQPDLES